ncbi:MAG: GAF domain-containing sensor histidine kinase [Chloroflexi bacterium]|nr:GAF domain-containing sensor histidine kinase [Chloroflexota bacterium]
MVDSYTLDENGQTLIVNLNHDSDGRLFMCLGPKTTEEPFQPEDLELAQTVANHVATVVEKLQLFDELQIKASELTELNRRLVNTQETERARIASYLHDDSLAQISNMMWRYSEDDFPPGALDDLQAISRGLRDISTSLHPGVLEELGLSPALDWLGNEAAMLAGFDFKLHHGGIAEDLGLAPETQLALYRIAQEALNNCQRHSKADNVWIRLAQRGDEIEMTIEDDGVGLPEETDPGQNVRLGLVGMRERAQQAGGRFRLLKHNPTGTTVLVCLPIRNNSESKEHDTCDKTHHQGSDRR